MKITITSVLLLLTIQVVLIGAQVGQIVRLEGHKLSPDSKPVAIATVKPQIIDSIVDEMEKDSLRGVFYFIKEEKATLLPEGTRVKVVKFSRTPRRNMSCAEVEILDGQLKGHKVWTPLNKD